MALACATKGVLRMPTYKLREADSGTTCIVQVRIKGYKPAANTFHFAKGAPTKLQTAGGKRIRVPLAAVEWAEALEKELRSEAGRGTPKADLPNLTIGALNKDYLDEPEVKAKKSFEEIQRLIAWWTNNYGGTKVFDFGVQALREARKKLALGGRGNATINRHLSQMRACWNWGIAAEFIPASRPWPKKLMLSEPPGRTRFLDDAEMAAVLAELDKPNADAMVRAMVIMSIATGLRQAEVRTLKWADVDLAGSKAIVRNTKNGETRAVYVGASAVEQIKALRRLPVVSTTWLFPGRDGKAITKDAARGRWNKISKAVGLKDFRWHDLRHTNASLMLQGGTTLAQLGKLLGHKSPSMTNRYAHMVPGAALPGHATIEAKLKGRPAQ